MGKLLWKMLYRGDNLPCENHRQQVTIVENVGNSDDYKRTAVALPWRCCWEHFGVLSVNKGEEGNGIAKERRGGFWENLKWKFRNWGVSGGEGQDQKGGSRGIWGKMQAPS